MEDAQLDLKPSHIIFEESNRYLVEVSSSVTSGKSSLISAERPKCFGSGTVFVTRGDVFTSVDRLDVGSRVFSANGLDEDFEQTGFKQYLEDLASECRWSDIDDADDVRTWSTAPT
jgi:hypothetical protein